MIDHLQGIRELIRNGVTANLRHWGDGKFVLGDGNGHWHYEGFVNLLQALHEAMRAVDPSIPEGLPPHCLDPEVIARFFRIPLEDMNFPSKTKPETTKAEPPSKPSIASPSSPEYLLLEKVADRICSLEKKLDLARVKETYTPEEVAAQVEKSPWVVRQWCNKGQVPGAYKIQTGRGKKGEWRIPHETVLRLQNEGPLALAE
jgi:hypothetical protein